MFPYFKVFIDNQSFMNILWYTNEQKHGFQRNGQIGEGLVSFCELDLSAFEEKLKELARTSLTSSNYDMIRNGIFDAAELLKTCQEVGPMLHYEQRLEADDYLQQFETEYNKVYSRFYRADGKTDAEFSGKDMTREEFRVWSKAASKAKADYQRKLITGDEMLRIVRN
jgi:hypothetical protein